MKQTLACRIPLQLNSYSFLDCRGVVMQRQLGTVPLHLDRIVQGQNSRHIRTYVHHASDPTPCGGFIDQSLDGWIVKRKSVITSLQFREKKEEKERNTGVHQYKFLSYIQFYGYRLKGHVTTNIMYCVQQTTFDNFKNHSTYYTGLLNYQADRQAIPPQCKLFPPSPSINHSGKERIQR